MTEPKPPTTYARIERAIILASTVLAALVALAVNASWLGPALAARFGGGSASPVTANAVTAGLNLLVLLVAFGAARARLGRRIGWLPQVHLMVLVGLLVALSAAYLIEVSLASKPAPVATARTLRSIRLKERPPGQDLLVPPSEAVAAIADTLEVKPYRIRTDADGFLLPSPPRSEGDYAIVFLGGSTTECAFMGEGERFVALVNDRLAESVARPVAAYNGGVSGNTAMHSVNILINKVLPTRPDAVVLMHNINDVVTLLYTGTYWNDHPRRSMIEVRTVGGKAGPPWTPIAFPRTAGWIGGKIAQLAAPVEVDEWAGYRARLQLRPEKIERDFVSALRTFVGVCRAWGVEPVLMTQAARMPVEPKSHVQKAWIEAVRKGFDADALGYADLRALHRRLNDAIRRVATADGVRVVDLARAIPADSEHMYDIVHLTPAGSKLAAEVITGELTPMLADR